MIDPVEELFPKKILDPKVNEILREFSDNIADAVNFGSHVLKWEASSIHGRDEYVPIWMSIRHFLELLDSISILVRSASIEPCKIIMRGLLETYFNLEYLLEKDTKNRCMAFLACYYYKKLKFYNKLDNQQEQGREFQAKINKDKTLRDYKLPNIPALDFATKDLEKLLLNDAYQPAMQEINKFKKKFKKDPEWYSLFDGPKNMQELTNRLSLNIFYEFFYRNYSGTTHANDIFEGRYSVSNNRKLEIIQIRTPKNAQDITRTCMTISFKLYGLLIRKRSPEKLGEYLKWRETNREFYKKISTIHNLLATV